jgi:hypothetical protein
VRERWYDELSRDCDLGLPTFDCGIVLVDEMALNQLNGQARFTDTTTANNDELVLSHELGK